jgi:hypothetical protein
VHIALIYIGGWISSSRADARCVFSIQQKEGNDSILIVLTYVERDVSDGGSTADTVSSSSGI